MLCVYQKINNAMYFNHDTAIQIYQKKKINTAIQPLDTKRALSKVVALYEP